MIENIPKFIFVIDTNQYSGNFEREMCAFVTGKVGDCDVGHDFVEDFKRDVVNVSFDNIMHISDDNDCSRPCSIFPTEGVFNNGYGFHYAAGEEEKALNHYKGYRESSYKHQISTYEKYKQEIINGVPYITTVEECDDMIRYYQKQIEENKETKELQPWPAYQSVAISFSSKPTNEQISLMKERSKKFYGHAKDKLFRNVVLEIKGFRLVEVKYEVNPI